MELKEDKDASRPVPHSWCLLARPTPSRCVTHRLRPGTGGPSRDPAGVTY